MDSIKGLPLLLLMLVCAAAGACSAAAAATTSSSSKDEIHAGASAMPMMINGQDVQQTQLKPTHSSETYDLYQIIEEMPPHHEQSNMNGGTTSRKELGKDQDKEKNVMAKEFAMCKPSTGACANKQLACPSACVQGFYGGGGYGWGHGGGYGWGHGGGYGRGWGGGYGHGPGGWGGGGGGGGGGWGRGGGGGSSNWSSACKYDCTSACMASCQK